jgi:hypothetical protein
LFSLLSQDRYDAALHEQMSNARLVSDVTDVDRVDVHDRRALLLAYGSPADFVRIANFLRIMDDEKAGIFRTAYHGVVTFRRRGRQIFIAPDALASQSRRPLNQ